MLGTIGRAAGGNVIVALDATTGKEAWRLHVMARPSISAPVLRCGYPAATIWNSILRSLGRRRPMTPRRCAIRVASAVLPTMPSIRIRLCDGKYGRLEAINIHTRQIAWIARQRAPQTTGVLATAGGVVFAGALDRMFSAYDSATGTLLWKTRLN